MKKNLLSRLRKTLSLVEECRCCYKSWCCHLDASCHAEDCCCHPASHRCRPETHPRHPEFPLRHPEFISGSQESKEMLNPVQHDDCLSGKMLKQVQHDDNSTGQASNSVQNGGWHRTSLAFGRSMIEMLGVLAIIGVLSIGGLYVYRQAMMRYRINQTQDWFSRMRFAINERCMDDTTTCADGLADNSDYAKRRDILCASAGPDFCINPRVLYGDFPYAPKAKWFVFLPKEKVMVRVYFTGLDKTICQAFIQHDWGHLYEIMVYGTGTVFRVPAKGQPLPQDQKDTLKALCPFPSYFAISFYLKD